MLLRVNKGLDMNVVYTTDIILVYIFLGVINFLRVRMKDVMSLLYSSHG